MSFRGRGLVARALALALVSAVALTSAFALAGSDEATIEATEFTPLDEAQGGEEFAKCGPGERALGGGVVQSGSADSLRVQASGPLDASGLATQTKDGDKAKQWYASVASGVDDQVFRVFAICATDSNATIEATKLIVDSGLRGEEFAKCGPGERALGGGVLQQSGSAESFGVQASGPLDASGITLNTNDGDKAKQWYASVSQASGIDDRVIKVFAICA